MTLNSNYNYLFLDFETTGLDVTTDHPIQIALILVDHHFQVVKSYSSYISVPDSVLSLKSNVSYMTGIDMETITSQGQEITTIQAEITEFFGDNTIIIGQNINFDIWFLKKFFPDCRFKYSIDTYPLATSMIPYLKSYSLEAIDQHIDNKYESYKDRKSYLLQTLSTDKVLSSHDALYDCVVGLSFVQRWTEQYESFAQEFPILNTIIQKTEQKGIFEFIVSPLILSRRGVKGEVSLPTLSSPLKTEKKSTHETTVNREKTPQHSKWLSKDIPLQTMIHELPQPSIIAVSHASKIDIIKRACPNISFQYLKEEQIIDQIKLESRLQKDIRSEQEVLFIIFYLAHHRDGYRVLNPILPLHKYILEYLQDKKSTLDPTKHILCSHWWLYYTMSQQENWEKNFKHYPIALFDADFWHTTYNDFAQKGMNLTSTIAQREKTQYILTQQASQDEQTAFNQLVDYRQLFLGYFGIESEKYLEHLWKIEIDYFAEYTQYTKTNGLRATIKDEWQNYTNTYQNHTQLDTLIKKIDQLFHNPLIIRRMVSNNKDISYTIAPSVRYIDFAEYLKLFGNQKLYFFSPSRKEYNHRLPPQHKDKVTIQESDTIPKVMQILQNSKGSSFIISHNSEKSKKLFQELHNQWFAKTHHLIGEYLTWWVGKSTTMMNSEIDSIMIGGYHMLLQLRAQGKKVDHIIILYIHHSLKSFIHDDIQQYAPE